jgi:hypothetical protein
LFKVKIVASVVPACSFSMLLTVVALRSKAVPPLTISVSTPALPSMLAMSPLLAAS